MNGWLEVRPRVAFCQRSAPVQTHPSPIVGARVLYFPFIFMVILIPTVKSVRTSALRHIGRRLEGYTASPVRQARCAHWNHLGLSHLVPPIAEVLDISDGFFPFYT